MKKHIYSVFAVLLVAVFMLNCETGDPLIQPIKAGIDSKDYQSALSAADTAIAKDPTNAAAYYYKAVVLSKIAENENVISDRKPTYEDMRSALNEAESLYATAETQGVESALITPLILNTWSLEHNSAIKYATDDSVMATVDKPLEISIAHLVNATTINPDSILSFDVLAQIYYMNSEFEKAAEALTIAVNLQDQGLASEYDRLGTYYFLSEQPDKAVAAIEEGLEIYPDSTGLIQKLADGLFQIDRTDEALKIMEKLIASDPNNARYRLVVGSRVYQRVLTLTETYDANADSLFNLNRNDGPKNVIQKLESENKALEMEINELTDRAEKALLKAAELDDTMAPTFNTLGILYQNKYVALFNKRNNTLDNDEADKFDKMAREEARRSMLNYEKAAEIDPDNTTYWSSLFRIYTLLDMREKAEAAMEKAGM